MELNKFFEEIRCQIKQYFFDNKERILRRVLDIELKSDRSLVTEADLEISKIIEKCKKTHLNKVCFYSEENFNELNFPALIVDPIDGTKEFSMAIGECAVSIAYVNSSDISDPKNHAWLYNPFTGFELETGMKFIEGSRNYFEKDFSCLVSRTEWSKGVYNNVKLEKTIISPRGSIAYKLGLLASGGCDFVYSHNPKNIWDIAAGSILCFQRGIKFFNKGCEITDLGFSKIEGQSYWISETLTKDLAYDLEKLLEN
jgi:myo-inositol-1(or 4)-monophosphatase